MSKDKIIYKQIFDNSKTPIAIVDSGYELLDANKSFISLIDNSNIKNIKEYFTFITETKLFNGCQDCLLLKNKLNNIIYSVDIQETDDGSKILFFEKHEDLIDKYNSFLNDKLSITGKLGLLVFDKEKRIIHANKVIEKMLGVNAENYLYQKVDEIKWDKKDFLGEKLVSKDEIYRTLKSKKCSHLENKITINIEGKEIHTLVNAYSLEDEEGNFDGYFVVLSDKTAEFVSKKKLIDSEKRYLDLLKNIPLGILIQQDNKTVYANDRALEIFGIDSKEEILGKDLIQLFPQEHQQKLLKRRENVYSGYDNPSTLMKFENKKGRVIWSESIIIPIIFNGEPAALSIAKDVTEQEKMNIQLKESRKEYKEQQEYLEQILNSIDIAIWSFVKSGDDFIFTSSNKYFQQKMGIQQNQIIGKPLDDLIGIFEPGYIEDVKEKYQECFIAEKTLEYEEKLLVNNSYIYGLTKLIPRFDKEGNIKQVIGTGIDITNLKETQIALTESEDRLKLALKAANDGLWDWNLEDESVYFSPRWKEIIGFSDEELTNKFGIWDERLHPDDYQKSQNLINKFIEGHSDRYESEFRLKHKNGSWIHILSKGLAIRQSNGKVKRIIGTHTDITERVLAEQKLKRSEERLKLTVENTGVGLWDWNVQTNELVLNENWAALIGYTLDELKPLTIDKWNGLTHPEDLISSEKLLKKHFNNEIEQYKIEVRMKHKLGHWVWLIDSGKVTEWDVEGNPLRMIGSHYDITDRKKNELADTIAHKLNKMGDSESIEKILEFGLEQCIKITDSKIGFLHFIDSKDKELTLQLWSNHTIENCNVKTHLLHNSIENAGIWTESYFAKKPVIHNNYKSNQNRQGLPEGHNEIEREITIPIIDNKQVVAILGAGNKPYDYNENDIQFLNLICETMWRVYKQKEAEINLKESEYKYRQLFSNLTTGFVLHEIILDSKGKPVDYVFLDSNKAYEEMTGLKLSHTKGKTVLELLPNTEKIWIEKYGRVALTGEPEEFENYTVELDKYYYVHAYSPVKYQFAVLVTDVTEKHKHEQAIRESEEKFRQLAENIEQAFWLRSKDRLLYISPAYEKITGKSCQLLYDDINIFLDSIIEEDKQEVAEYFNNIEFVSNEDIYYEYRIKTPDGKTKWIKAQTFPIFDLEGNVERRAGIAEDITERKSIEKELITSKEKAEESDRLKSAFLANVSHEIRTPMNAIIGFSRMLSEPDVTKEEQEEFIKIINSSSSQLLAIINDVIDISKIESGTIKLNIAEFNNDKLLEDLKSQFYQQALDKNLLVKIEDNSPGIYYKGDIAKIKQILSNLINNSLKFTEKGSITIKHEKINNSTIFAIKDTGIGIAEENQEIIFQRFRQIEDHLTRYHSGTGLGLSIVKSLVDKMQGDIQIESEIGKGTEFIVTLPLRTIKKENTKIEKTISMNDKENQLKDYTILIAEDDESSIDLLKRYLQPTGINILHARNGLKAVEIMAQSNKIDIVLLDIKMPMMSGYEAIKIIRKNHPHIPIIAQTAYAMADDKDTALKAGFTDYISKPINKEEFVNYLSIILIGKKVYK